MALQIRTAQIRDLAIETAKIAANAVEAGKADLTDTWDFSSGTIQCATPSNSTDVANKAYVDSVAVGLNWKSPVSVLKLKSDATQAGSPPTAGEAGEAWVVDTWGGGYNDGDIVEWDGFTTWNVVVSNSGGYPPADTRCIVIDSGAAGSFTGLEDDYVTADGAGNWSNVSPSDADAVLIGGENSIYENQGYVYDIGTGWIQFAGPNLYTAGQGIAINNNTIAASLGKGLEFDLTDQIRVKLGSDGGLYFDGSNQLAILPGDGIEIDGSNQVGIKLTGTSPGLQFVGAGTDELQVLTATASGTGVDANGIKVVVESNKGLTVGANGVAGVADASKAMTVGANGFGLQFALESKTDWDGSTEQTYALAYTPLEDGNNLSPFCCIYYEGQKMMEVAAAPGQGEYTISTKTVTFGFYPALNSKMVFEYLHQGT
jgi:hypothetical protein